MDALEANVRVVLLEVEVHGEADVGALDGVHVLAAHLELGEVEVLREYLHLLITLIYYNRLSKS